MSASWSPSPLIPPFRFGTVEPEVYRGAYPKQRNLRYLKRLKLRTVLSLIPDAPDAAFEEFCAQQGIRSIHLPVDKVKDNVPLTYNRAVEAVQVIIDQENLPIYIHCLDGASVTGLVVCCLRKLQTWNISSALGEFLRYLRGGVISSEESSFVEKFSSEIEISKPIPAWLWEGQVTFKKHPTLKLKFTIPPAAAAASNATNTSTSSPVLGSQNATTTATGGTAVVFPNQQGEGYSGSGNNNNNNSSNSNNGRPSTPHGSTVNSNSNTGSGLSNGHRSGGENISIATKRGNSQGIGGDSTTHGSLSGLSATETTTDTPGEVSPATPMISSNIGLLNHANRSSAKGGPSHIMLKNVIRTDIGGSTGYSGGSRNNSIATPTITAMSRSKQGLLGGPSALGPQQQQQKDQSSKDSVGSTASLGEHEANTSSMSASGDGSGASGLNSEAGNTAASGDASTDSSLPAAESHVISVTHTEPRGGSENTAGPDESGAEGSNATATATSAASSQDRGVHISTAVKNSPSSTTTSVAIGTPTPAQPTPVEAVEEYYEVSMTLKALALEGADF